MNNRAHKGTLLLADDDDSFREPYARLLRSHGYEVVSAGDGPSALKILREQEIDALISDIDMPGNADLELIQAIPRISRGFPVILLTGRPSFQTATQSVRLAVCAYLLKPVDITEVFAVLDEAIPRYRKLRALADSRKRLQQWAEELQTMEEELRHSTGLDNEHLSRNYLSVTLYNMVGQLADLLRALAVCPDLNETEQLRKVELVAAVQQTINVLESTRQSFKSKQLGDLRRGLTLLLKRTEREDASEVKTEDSE